jgi:hypothetical protein
MRLLLFFFFFFLFVGKPGGTTAQVRSPPGSSSLARNGLCLRGWAGIHIPWWGISNAFDVLVSLTLSQPRKLLEWHIGLPRAADG